MTNSVKKPYVVGIDLGGTNTAFGIVDEKGNVVAQNSIKTQQYPDLNDYMSALSSAIKALIEESKVGIANVNGIGIGAPNANYYTGNIEHAANLPWKGIVSFAKLLSESTGLPVSLTNDANAAAIGEATYGVAKGMKDFIMITLGTGVGSGIYCNGKLLYGSDGNAGELGHVVVRRNGRPCGCGRSGCLEAYCSATGVARTARELLSKTQEPSLLRELDPEAITSLDVSIAAGKGDALAKHIYEFTGEMLGEACADFAAFSSPEAFIFFGGMTKAGDLIMDPIKRSYDKNVLKIFKGKAKFLVSGLDGSSAAVLGASAVGWEM